MRKVVPESEREEALSRSYESSGYLESEGIQVLAILRESSQRKFRGMKWSSAEDCGEIPSYMRAYLSLNDRKWLAV